jgi:transcription antitermination factor NusG
MSQQAWYAIYTRHQHEKSAAQLLSHKGFDTFLPLYSATHQWKDRKKEVSLPLFPCYVFLNGDLGRSLDVLKTPGVVGFVSSAGQPAVIPTEQMEAVRHVVLRSRAEPHPFLQTGDRVRVRAGSLAGVEGILVRKKNLCRLVISVDILGQSVATEIDASLVERVRRAA